LGVYFLEEHFEKELLESQGRREGPIVVWDESTLWATLLAEGNVPAKGVAPLASSGAAGAHTSEAAAIRAFGEKRLGALDGLNRLLSAALEEMRALRALALTDQPETSRARVYQALDELQGRTLERLVDVERLGAAHALLSLFQSEHALAWHNQRWYHDPVQERLEPVLFDCAAQDPAGREPVPWRATDLTAAFAKSPAYQAALFEHLGRLVRSDWLDAFFAALEPELARFEAALAAEEELPSGHAVGEMKQRLRAQVLLLRKAVLPVDGVNFECSYELTDPAANAGQGWLEVRAWATTRAPVLVEGFRFSNGSTLPAAGALAGARGALRRGRAVMLPVDGTAALFRFAMNERLANLETVEKITRALRQELTEGHVLDLDVHALHRPLAAEDSVAEPLTFRRALPPLPQAGRPRAPELETALELHLFLRFDPLAYELSALPGTWDVAGDLVLPSGIPLSIGPGTTLRFQGGACLLTDAPLVFAGSGQAPVVLEPLDPAAPWAGVVVLGAEGRSHWSEVRVRATTAALRGGWALTGAVTFYRSPVTMERVRFEGTQAEDALNVFGADLALSEVHFERASSDSFDGDFVTGTFERCHFVDGAADGLDVSGSDVAVRDCTFERLGDKALSIGERSRARVEGGSARDVSVGVAAKDASEVELEGFDVEARHYGLAAFVKKSEYGPARLSARGCTLAGALGTAIAQTGCVLELDGQAIATQDVDVEASYEEGVLGRAK
jgi:hypothetical protein